MATIDDKVVAMSFESAKFEAGVNRSISSLDKLKAALHFPNAGKGLNDLNVAAKNVQLGHITQGVDGIKKALESLRLVAIGVMANLASSAVRAAGAFVKSFTFAPIKQGFQEYETNIKSIQTILANTQAAGTTLKDVTEALKELNEYSDKTIYNFSQMAKNIGTFTAAGVALKPATSAIKGIANLAALSGSSAEQASSAMYQLSQAIAAGRVNMQDWISVRNAGMGGTVFQRALAETAEAMGVLKKGAVELVGPMKNVKVNGEAFTRSISSVGGKSTWLTSDVLVKTLAQFTGDLKDAELAAMGFNDAQIAAIQKTAQTALFAATKVKTFTDLISTTKEQVATGWAETFTIVIGGFHEATKLFTGISSAIGDVVQANADARNKVLQAWKDLGGRTLLIDSFKNAFQALGAILGTVRAAFRDIFPAQTGKSLFELTQRFHEFTESLKPSLTTIKNLRATFRGIFAIFSIGMQVVKGIFSVFGQLFGVVSTGRGSFLEFTASIGDWLVSVDKALKKSGAIQKFFEGLGKVLSAPIELIQRLAGAIAELFAGFSSGGVSDGIGEMTDALSPLEKILSAVGNAWNAFLDGISGSGDIFRSVGEALGKGLGSFVQAFGDAFANMNFEAILAVIRTGLLGGLVLMFRKFLGKGSAIDQITKGFGGGILENISGSFKALEGSMVALQNNIKAKTLKEIAIAIALLTASVVALSFVDPERLKSSLTAMTVAFGQLLGAMAILGNITKTVGFVKMPVIAGAMILLAGAIVILSGAVAIMAQLSWEELIKGLGGVGALLGMISVAVIPLSANSAGMVRAGAGIMAMAVGLRVMANAVEAFARMSLTELAKGLGSVAVSLGLMVAAMSKIKPAGMIAAGIAIIGIATGLRILAEAVQKLGGMDVRTIAQGMIGIGAALVIIAGAMRLMPKNMVLQAVALVAVAGALNLIARAVEQMGGMSLEQIGRGLGTLAGSLAILAAALYLMSGSVAGAVALGIAAAGVSLLIPPLVTLGSLSWGTIIKGLVALAAAFTVIGVAGYLITGSVPGLLGFGAALALIGIGVAGVGAGLFLISAAFSALIVSLPTGVGILIAAIVELQEGLIKNVKLLVLGLLEIARAFAATAPKFVEALVKILNSVIDGVIEIMPKVAELFRELIDMILSVIQSKQGAIIQAGMGLLIALLQGIRNNLPQLVTLAVDIVSDFIRAIGNNLNKILNAGVQLLASLIKGILQRITDVVTAVVDIITRFVGAITSNLGRIFTAGLSILARLLQAIASRIGDVIKMGVDIVVAFINGVGNAGPRIVTAAVNAITKFIHAISKAAVKLADEGMKAITNFLNGVATAIDNNAGEMRAAGMRVGVAIINGMTGGLVSKAGELYGKIESVMNKAVGLLHKIPGVRSPSTVTTDIGENIILGLVKGIDQTAPQAYQSAENMSNGVINSFNDVFQTHSPSKVMHEIGQFVGQGFAQGLRGSGEDIKGAFTELNEKLTDAMVKARETIASEQEKIDKERASKKPDAAAIKEAQKVIKENQALLDESRAGHILLTKALKDEKAELIGLATDYEKIGEKLKLAQDALADAKRTREDAVRGFTEQYSTLPEIVKEDAEGNAVDQLATYMAALDNQAKAVTAYQSTLDQLRKLGLDDATYQKLLKEGPQDQQFANQLLAGGKTAVQSLNTLDSNLMKVSKTLATNAAKNLYDAGVDAAAGLVKGLKSKQSDIREEMEEIAREMIRALKKELKIKSPSEAFAEIGLYSMEGMAAGFSKGTKIVTDAVDLAAQDAMTAMQRSMRDISDIVTDELNPNPVITPVLDLTQVRAQAGELNTLTTPAVGAYAQASTISAEQAAAAQTESTAAEPGGMHVKFEQNNYSPEALTEIEIYRQTKNQLSQLKSALALT